MLRRQRWGDANADTLPIVRAYRVRDEAVGKTVEQRKAELNLAGAALRLRRGNEIMSLAPDLELKEGDVVSVIASLSVHQWAQKSFGAECSITGY